MAVGEAGETGLYKKNGEKTIIMLEVSYLQLEQLLAMVRIVAVRVEQPKLYYQPHTSV